MEDKIINITYNEYKKLQETEFKYKYLINGLFNTVEYNEYCNELSFSNMITDTLIKILEEERYNDTLNKLKGTND